MSATMPTILENMVRDSLRHVLKIAADRKTLEAFRRHRLQLLQSDLLSDQVIKLVERDFANGKSVLIVATTVRRAQEFKAKLNHQLNPMILHGKFCARD